MATAPQAVSQGRREGAGALHAAAHHWPEYLMEAAELGLFMVSACVFAALLHHPSSSIAAWIESPTLRNALGGIVMGATAVAIIKSPFGKRSGAHFNPAVTMTFLLLGKVQRWDAVFYAAFQFIGAVAGVAVGRLLVGPPLEHTAVRYAVTLPGPLGAGVAFLAELLISFLMMSVILRASNDRRVARFTPFFAGAMVATYITLEAPLSGMSMNPARTLGSAALAREWTALWVYFTAPPLGMLLAGVVYGFRHGKQKVFCAKLDHYNNKRCIFRCRHSEM